MRQVRFEANALPQLLCPASGTRQSFVYIPCFSQGSSQEESSNQEYRKHKCIITTWAMHVASEWLSNRHNLGLVLLQLANVLVARLRREPLPQRSPPWPKKQSVQDFQFQTNEQDLGHHVAAVQRSQNLQTAKPFRWRDWDGTFWAARQHSRVEGHRRVIQANIAEWNHRKTPNSPHWEHNPTDLGLCFRPTIPHWVQI